MPKIQTDEPEVVRIFAADGKHTQALVAMAIRRLRGWLITVFMIVCVLFAPEQTKLKVINTVVATLPTTSK